MFVYVIVNAETLKIYVGQHKGKNLRQYLQQKLSEAKYGISARSRLYASMRKHPKAAWSIHPLVSELQTRAECDVWERHYIAALKTQHPDVGYNICRGGEGFTGVHSAAAKKKMRAVRAKQCPEVEAARNKARSEKLQVIMLGNTHGRGNKGISSPKSLEFRQRVSATLMGHKGYWAGKQMLEKTQQAIRTAVLGNKWNVGRKHSAETLAKMSQAQMGRRHSEESKQKMRKPKSPETIAKMRAAWVKRKVKV